jgi:hypothetical protein
MVHDIGDQETLHLTQSPIRGTGVRVGPWIGDLEDGGGGGCRWLGSELLPHVFFNVKPRGRTEVDGAIVETRA